MPEGLRSPQSCPDVLAVNPEMQYVSPWAALFSSRPIFPSQTGYGTPDGGGHGTKGVTLLAICHEPRSPPARASVLTAEGAAGAPGTGVQEDPGGAGEPGGSPRGAGLSHGVTRGPPPGAARGPGPLTAPEGPPEHTPGTGQCARLWTCASHAQLRPPSGGARVP